MRSVLDMVREAGRDGVAIAVGKDLNKNIMVKGHWVYVRKCKPPDHEKDGVTIFLPEKSKTVCLWNEVLAKGPQVGKPRDWAREWTDAKRRSSARPPKCLVDDLHVGDLVLVPDRHSWGFMHSPYADDEFFVDESVVIARTERTNEHRRTKSKPAN